MKIRVAERSDLPMVTQLVEEFSAEHHWAGRLPFDNVFFMQGLSDVLGAAGILVLLLDDNKGLLVGALGTTAFSAQKIAHELIWYTRPEARGYGLLLYEEFMRWARGQEVEYVFMTLPKASRAMKRLGFVEAEVGYVRQLQYNSRYRCRIE
ncbi:GNAT family N-acetyltransferase [Brucella anthropi]|uniref:GNAT family N-acetyltransferase n=1 Tax=Brucella anthropi TaxID=529 RepID=UPI00384B48A2